MQKKAFPDITVPCTVHIYSQHKHTHYPPLGFITIACVLRCTLLSSIQMVLRAINCSRLHSSRVQQSGSVRGGNKGHKPSEVLTRAGWLTVHVQAPSFTTSAGLKCLALLADPSCATNFTQIPPRPPVLTELIKHTSWNRPRLNQKREIRSIQQQLKDCIPVCAMS